MSSRLFQILLIASLLASVHGAGRGLQQVNARAANMWGRAAPAALAAPAAGQVKLAQQAAACPEGNYRNPAGQCVCLPGFGHRYSNEYCSKCPKGATQCDEFTNPAAADME